uniref:Uncharacterized protein n=1 Tax=Panagrolaimus davidi TaxID=227884 RepID=A0A914QKW3_9BILA
MTIHFGIYPSVGYCTYFDESKRRSIDLKTRPVNFNEIEKIALMFEEIKSKINGKLGYVCICLFENYGNEIRKNFIECGLKNGFENIEIINLETAIYLNAMSQINYKPLNGNVIWIQYSEYFFVWEINNQKAKFCGMWNADSSRLNELQKIVDESKLNKRVDVVLYHTKIAESNMRKMSECQCFYSVYDYWYSEGSLLKARIIAGDSELTHLETTYFLSRTFSLKIGNNVITSFQKTQQLPIFYTTTINKDPKNDTLKVVR